MPVFADVLPEPSIGYPIDLYSSPSVYVPEIGELFARIFGGLTLIILLAILAYWILCLWKIFNKAGLHGRGSLIPVYREYLRFKMVGRNGRWTATLLNPFMFAVVLIISFFKASEKFGKDKEQFGMGLWFLNPIFLGILAFDKSKYQNN